MTSLQVMNLSMRIVLMSGQFSTGNICAAKSGKKGIWWIRFQNYASTFLQNESIFNLVPLVALVWALCRRRRRGITSMLVCVLECVCVYWNVCVCVCVAMNVNLQWMIWQERVPRASDGSQVVECDVATETTKLKTRVCRHASCEAELRHSSVSS